MAKIIHKGMWVDISSLNPMDRKNFIKSFIFFFSASLCLGFHLGHIGFLGEQALENPVVAEPWLLAIIVGMILLSLMGALYYKKFYDTQDDLYKNYHNTTLAGGAYGFLIFGLLLTVLSPYFNYDPNFYEFFCAFALGTIVGAYYFYRRYIAEK